MGIQNVSRLVEAFTSVLRKSFAFKKSELYSFLQLFVVGIDALLSLDHVLFELSLRCPSDSFAYLFGLFCNRLGLFLLFLRLGWEFKLLDWQDDVHVWLTGVFRHVF